MNMRVLFDDDANELVGGKLNYLSMGELVLDDEESTSLVVSRGVEATPPDPLFTTDARIASLGNIRVWELAACMITASIILLFILIAIVKIVKRMEYEQEYAADSDSDAGDDDHDREMERRESKRRSVHGGQLFLTRTSSQVMVKPSGQAAKTIPVIVAEGSQQASVHLCVRNLAGGYSNQCLQLDTSDHLDSPPDSFA